MKHFNRLLWLWLIFQVNNIQAASLFFTPQQTTELNNAYDRWLNPPVQEPIVIETLPPEMPEPPPPSLPIKLQGFVIFDGESNGSAWLNNKSEKLPIKNGKVQYKTPEGYKTLNTGQSIDPATGKVVEPARTIP